MFASYNSYLKVFKPLPYLFIGRRENVPNTLMSNNGFTRRMPTAAGNSDEPVTLTLKDEDVFDAAEAIGSASRWEMLTAIAAEPRSIGELVDILDLSKGTVSVHVSQFEEAGILEANYSVSDDGGVEKEITLAVEELTLDLTTI